MNRSLIPWRRKKGELAPGEFEHPIETLHRQMDGLFEDFFGAAFGPRGLPRLSDEGRIAMLRPDVDLSETDDTFEVAAELPGLDEKDVSVTVSDNTLTLKGTKTSNREEKKRNYHFSERSFGEFLRVIPLPEGVDEAKVSATFKKGVLKVILPKTPQAKKEERKIDVLAE